MNLRLIKKEKNIIKEDNHISRHEDLIHASKVQDLFSRQPLLDLLSHVLPCTTFLAGFAVQALFWG